MKQRLGFPRELLLVEIERRCAAAPCKARTQIGLTKEEARAYNGFECERCARWNEDGLSERDIPEWWEELQVTGLDTLRTPEGINVEPCEVVERLSDAWREERGSAGELGDADGE
jgi:hypothetical protein